MQSLLVGLFCVASISADTIAQNMPQTQVPSVVLNAFQSKYPNATDIEWEQRADLYKVEFEIARRDHDLWIDKSGTIKKHKEDFPKSEIPAAIKQKLSAEFKDYRIDDVDKIEEGGKVLFQVDLDSNAGDRKVIFSTEGKIESNVADN